MHCHNFQVSHQARDNNGMSDNWARRSSGSEGGWGSWPWGIRDRGHYQRAMALRVQGRHHIPALRESQACTAVQRDWRGLIHCRDLLQHPQHWETVLGCNEAVSPDWAIHEPRPAPQCCAHSSHVCQGEVANWISALQYSFVGNVRGSSKPSPSEGQEQGQGQGLLILNY